MSTDVQSPVTNRNRSLDRPSVPAVDPDSTTPNTIEELAPLLRANSQQLWGRGLNWPVVVWIGLVHVFAVIAPFYYSWQALVVCLILIPMTGMFGVCMGYHRLLTHGSFKTFPIIRWILAFLGGLSGEGSALTWVAHHRQHHVYSDKEGDPHSPRDGKWWSHMFWFMPNFGRKWDHLVIEKYAPDLRKDKVMMIIHHLFLPSHIILGLALYCVGYFSPSILGGGWEGGLSMLLWGTGFRMVYVLHITWFVNSATHLWGSRRYETTDDSRNNWWVGFLAFGEGWHNNHHAYQHVASQAHRWWEFDPTYYAIWVMERFGLVWDVVRLRDIPHGTKPA